MLQGWSVIASLVAVEIPIATLLDRRYANEKRDDRWRLWLISKGAQVDDALGGLKWRGAVGLLIGGFVFSVGATLLGTFVAIDVWMISYAGIDAIAFVNAIFSIFDFIIDIALFFVAFISAITGILAGATGAARLVSLAVLSAVRGPKIPPVTFIVLVVGIASAVFKLAIDVIKWWYG